MAAAVSVFMDMVQERAPLVPGATSFYCHVCQFGTESGALLFLGCTSCTYLKSSEAGLAANSIRDLNFAYSGEAALVADWIAARTPSGEAALAADLVTAFLVILCQNDVFPICFPWHKHTLLESCVRLTDPAMWPSIQFLHVMVEKAPLNL